MTMTITIDDPELARMIEESGVPSTRDIPGAILLGRTADGRTREDFDDEDEFEMSEIMVGIGHATIADVSAYLAYEGKKARAAYLAILRLTAIRDGGTDAFDNLQPLCATCHSGAKASFERTGKLRGCDVDGVPLDTGHHWNQ